MCAKTYPLVFACPATGVTLFSHFLVRKGDESVVQTMRFTVRCPCCRDEHEIDGATSYRAKFLRRRERRASSGG